jgi:hypothetical protein
MSAWSRTTKPAADTTVPAANIFGVDADEARAVEGIAGPGWVHKIVIGNRTKYETLVAMKVGPTEDETDDSNGFPDLRVTILSGPTAASANLVADANATATFSVTIEAAPEGGNVAYYWQVSADTGATWANISNAVVYDGFLTNELTVLEPTGLDGNEYRVAIWGGDGDTGMTEVVSSNVALTVVE